MNQEPSIQQLFDLSGKTALVTGGAGHLGKAMSRALAEAGASVIVTSRDKERAQSAAGELPIRGHANHSGVSIDHLAHDGLEEAFLSLTKSGHVIDVLVNNGHEHTTSDLTNSTAADFNRQLANATGYFLLARLLRNHVVERGTTASVIMLGSMYGLVGSYPNVYEGVSAASPAAYHVLKGGILQLTRHLAVYWACDGVRVNAISPGPFPGSGAPDELKNRLEQRSPMRRLGCPHELKGAVVFLASDASSYVTGHNLVVDGGWTAW